MALDSGEGINSVHPLDVTAPGVVCSDLERQYEFFKMWSRRRGLHERYDTWKLTRWGHGSCPGLKGCNNSSHKRNISFSPRPSSRTSPKILDTPY